MSYETRGFRRDIAGRSWNLSVVLTFFLNGLVLESVTEFKIKTSIYKSLYHLISLSMNTEIQLHETLSIFLTSDSRCIECG